LRKIFNERDINTIPIEAGDDPFQDPDFGIGPIKTEYQTYVENQQREANLVPEEVKTEHTIGVYPENPTLPKHWSGCYTIHLPCALKRIERLTRILILSRRRHDRTKGRGAL